MSRGKLPETIELENKVKFFLKKKSYNIYQLCKDLNGDENIKITAEQYNTVRNVLRRFAHSGKVKVKENVKGKKTMTIQYTWVGK